MAVLSDSYKIQLNVMFSRFDQNIMLNLKDNLWAENAIISLPTLHAIHIQKRYQNCIIYFYAPLSDLNSEGKGPGNSLSEFTRLVCSPAKDHSVPKCIYCRGTARGSDLLSLRQSDTEQIHKLLHSPQRELTTYSSHRQ